MSIPFTLPSNTLIQGLAAPARQTRDEIDRLAVEISTGRRADAGDALNHDFSALGLIERDLSIADNIRFSIGRGQRVGEAAQNALAAIDTELSNLREGLVPMVTGKSQVDPSVIASNARQAFDQMIAMINAQQDGGAIFAGGRGDTLAVDTSDAILTDLRVAVAGATSPADLRGQIGAYFAPGGAFETDHVTAGSDGPLAFRTAHDRAVSFDLRADDPRFQRALESVATLMLMAESPSVNDTAAQDYIALQATADIAQVQDGIILMGADVGRVNAALETAETSLGAAIVRAQTARDALIGADPYETATRIQEETARLETIYTLTARLSRLRLTDFL